MEGRKQLFISAPYGEGYRRVEGITVECCPPYEKAVKDTFRTSADGPSGKVPLPSCFFQMQHVDPHKA